MTEIEDRLRKKLTGYDPHLVMRSLISRDAVRLGPVFLSEEERQRREKGESEAQTLQSLSRALSDQLRQVPGARLVDIRRDSGEEGGVYLVTAVVRTPTPITPDEVKRIEAAVSERATPLRLVIRSVITQDADATRYLYSQTAEPPPLSAPEIRLRDRLRGALNRNLAAQIPGAYVTALEVEPRGLRLDVMVTAKTPRNFEPGNVLAVQDVLRKNVSPNIDLVVRSEVGIDTSATGYRAPR